MDFELLYKFFEGLTSNEENEKIKAWMDESPENVKRLKDERKIYDAIILHSKETVTDLVEIERDETPRKRILYFSEILKIAAVFLITLLGSWYFFKSDKIDSNPVAMQTISVPAGQRLNLTLPDGTNVWLNAKTTIQYPISFNSDQRLITIDGQAYFDVAKNEKVPFIVKSPKGTVHALGTKFDVLDYSDDDEFETMLMEGSVKVDLMNDLNQSIILSPDNKSFLENGKLESIKIYDQSEYAWKEGLISFRNEPFKEIMQTFERTYDIKIIIENVRIRDISYTGKFRIIDGVEYALRVLQRDVNFKFERDVDKHIIYIR